MVSIRGTVTGRVHGRQRIELLAGLAGAGHPGLAQLVIEEGAFFQGECDMGAAAERRPWCRRAGAAAARAAASRGQRIVRSMDDDQRERILRLTERVSCAG